MSAIHDAIDRACADVGIIVPRDYKEGRWTYTDTFERNGKNDGRVLVDGDRVAAKNWQTGVTSTIRIGEVDPEIRRKTAERRQRDEGERKRKIVEAARIAALLVRCAKQGTHPYLAAKGFPTERALVIDAAAVADIGGAYLVPEKATKAIVIPARMGDRITSCQLIWADGTKKFLFGGEMGGATHRLAQGTVTWLCEGYATGLSLRNALRSMNRRDGILVCFSASNLAAVAKRVQGRAFVAADNDKPLDVYDGLGTGEHYAKQTGLPYAMPATLKTDLNDMHMGEGEFAVQRLLLATIRQAVACG